MIQVGQVYADRDKRIDRRLRVVEVGDEFTHLENVETGKKARISNDRLGGRDFVLQAQTAVVEDEPATIVDSTITPPSDERPPRAERVLERRVAEAEARIVDLSVKLRHRKQHPGKEGSARKVHKTETRLAQAYERLAELKARL
jgi:hypothetical protein